MGIAGVGVTNVLSYQIARAVVHPEQAILPLKLRRFTEFAAHRAA